MKELSERIEKLTKLINEAEYIIIGAGAGLSTAAGIDYGGERFKKNFSDYIEKYDFTDMYSSGFYPFETEEEKWAYWARHIYLNSTGMEATELYKKLLKLVKDEKYFIITTNVDNQFIKAGFNRNNIFATQGSYNLIQCKNACHNKLYDATDLVEKLRENTSVDLKVPTELVPKCPICGGEMDVNLRKDHLFVEDDTWHKQNKAYTDFINNAKNSKTVLLEFGIGFNTPGIIRFPFESMTTKIKEWNLARFNKDYLEIVVDYHGTGKLVSCDSLDSMKLQNDFQNRYIPFSEDIELILNQLI
ncbi:Sir2 family NAD-dependent protein deacetylase [Methanosphaera sp. WGK6]|uniref:Sir2 family NAD-dependent protein deacetylase n=1 Tax=Methanosphaera sp. WGK6 TaxID=1561964 RepID=UPI00084CA7E3|nr:Sir2 family NAD-dependent protein deacetylase [Methanosphaera sp. WGK6]